MRQVIALLLMAFFVGLGIMQLPAQAPPQPQPMARIYTALITDTEPQIRAGRTFVPIRAISERLGATVSWNPQTQLVLIQQANQPDISLTVNARAAQIGDRAVTLEAAPFIFNRRTMVPLRFIAEGYGVPVEYNTPTRSVYLYTADRLYVLPLPSTQSGVVIADPRPGQLVRNPIRVQGQGNVFEGHLIVEVQDANGRLIARSFTTAGMGAFYPFSTQIYYNMPSEDAVRGRIVVYSQNGQGNGRILARDSVEVMLASTI